MNALATEQSGEGFTQEDLARDTIIGGRIVQNFVEVPTFSRESQLRDTYLITKDSFPYMIAADRLGEPTSR